MISIIKRNCTQIYDEAKRITARAFTLRHSNHKQQTRTYTFSRRVSKYIQQKLNWADSNIIASLHRCRELAIITYYLLLGFGAVLLVIKIYTLLYIPLFPFLIFISETVSHFAYTYLPKLIAITIHTNLTLFGFYLYLATFILLSAHLERYIYKRGTFFQTHIKPLLIKCVHFLIKNPPHPPSLGLMFIWISQHFHLEIIFIHVILTVLSTPTFTLKIFLTFLPTFAFSSWALVSLSQTPAKTNFFSKNLLFLASSISSSMQIHSVILLITNLLSLSFYPLYTVIYGFTAALPIIASGSLAMTAIVAYTKRAALIRFAANTTEQLVAHWIGQYIITFYRRNSRIHSQATKQHIRPFAWSWIEFSSFCQPIYLDPPNPELFKHMAIASPLAINKNMHFFDSSDVITASLEQPAVLHGLMDYKSSPNFINIIMANVFHPNTIWLPINIQFGQNINNENRQYRFWLSAGRPERITPSMRNNAIDRYIKHFKVTLHNWHHHPFIQNLMMYGHFNTLLPKLSFNTTPLQQLRNSPKLDINNLSIPQEQRNKIPTLPNEIWEKILAYVAIHSIHELFTHDLQQTTRHWNTIVPRDLEYAHPNFLHKEPIDTLTPAQSRMLDQHAYKLCRDHTHKKTPLPSHQ